MSEKPEFSKPTRKIKSRQRGRPRASASDGGASTAELLIEAALGAFATSGFKAASLRQIATVVGVDVTLITHHFGSKLGLWRSVIDTASRRLVEAINELEPPSHHITPTDRLTDVLGQIVDIVCDTPHLAPFVMLELVHQGERFDYFRERMVQPIHDALVPLMAASIDEQPSTPMEADYLFIAISGAIVTSVTSRPFLKRLTSSAERDDSFRRELKRVVVGMAAAHDMASHRQG